MNAAMTTGTGGYATSSTSIARVVSREWGRSPDIAQSSPVVFVVDHDIRARESLGLLIGSEGWRTETFASAQEFLARPQTTAPCCLVLDVSLPAQSGLQLQERLAKERRYMPIIFVAGHADVPTTVRAMKGGAVEFLTKPINEEVLLRAIREGMEHSRASLAQQMEMRALRDRYNDLSCREREVMALVAFGLLNKQVGGELGISEITVKAHRGRVMQKMNANSLPDLVRMATKLEVAAVPKEAAPRAGSGVAFLYGRPSLEVNLCSARTSLS